MHMRVCVCAPMYAFLAPSPRRSHLDLPPACGFGLGAPVSPIELFYFSASLPLKRN